MKVKFISAAVILLILNFTDTDAQLAKDSWSFGFGGSFPKLLGTNVNTATANKNYGAFLYFQRNLTEHFGIRLSGDYLHIEGKYGVNNNISTTEAFSGNLGFVYYFVPCESISPYLIGGLGGIYYKLTNPETASLGNSYTDYQINFGVGAEWSLGSDLKLLTEFNYHEMNGSRFDGSSESFSGGSILGTNNDSYGKVSLGFIYYFSKGEPSNICQIYDGISVDVPEVDYNRIEDIVQRNIPKEVIKEVVVEKQVQMEQLQRFVLVGVSFGFNSYELLPQSYPTLFHAVQVLLMNPDWKVEIQGYSDNIGSDEANQVMSQKRADVVRNYLVARGVNPDNLTAFGYGSVNPISDNASPTGRAMNRRIEFKILN